MTESQKEWAQRLILLGLVWLAAWLIADTVGGAAALVFTWLLEVWSDLHGSPAVIPWVWGVVGLALAGVDLFAAGFGFCLLLEPDWKRAGALSWLVFCVIVPAATAWRLGFGFGAAWLVQLAVGAAASLWGARTAMLWRHQEHVRRSRDVVLRATSFD